MMNLLMREDKTIRLTNIVPLYQYDSLMNPIRVLVPRLYDGIDLSEYNVVLTYMLPDETIGSITLELDEEPYNENYISYRFPVTSELTAIVGHICVKLTFTKVETQNEIEKVYMLTTQICKIPIYNADDMTGDIDQSDLARIEAQIADINQRLNIEAAKVANIDEYGIKIVL